MLDRCLRYRAPVLWLLLPFMGGLIVGQLSPSSWPVGWLLGGAFVCACAALLSYTRKAPWSAFLLLAVFLTGIARYELQRARIEKWDTLPAREALLTVSLDRLFAPSADGKHLNGLAHITSADAHLHELLGQPLYFSLNVKPGDATPACGTEFQLLGVLQPLPRQAPADSFDSYLTHAGYNFKLSRGRLLAFTRAPGPYAHFCNTAFTRFVSILDHSLENHPHLTSVYRAMLLGDVHDLDPEQKTQFLQSGTMHLFSISGLHIGVIAIALNGLLSLLRLPRWPLFLISLTALWLYVDITGASPSAIRAFVMVTLVQAAFILRLPINPVSALAVSAFLAVVAQPMQLFTASFQLSYGIVATLLLMGLPLSEALKRFWQPFRDLPKASWRWPHHALDLSWQWLASALAIGLSTSLISAIYGVLYFKLITPGALLANLVLIPVSMLVILSGFVSLLSGLLGLLFLSTLSNYAAALILLAIEHILTALLRLPGMFTQASFPRLWTGHLLAGVFLATLFYSYTQRWSWRRGGFALPCILTAAGLVLLAKFT